MFSQKIDTQIVVTVLNLHIKNYNCPFYVDNERDEYILPQQLDLCVKLNNRHLTLKLLCMIKILSILDKNTKCICVRDAINTLYIPHVIKLEIAEEHEYQVDLYFDIVIEPKIAYTYPNQY